MVVSDSVERILDTFLTAFSEAASKLVLAAIIMLTGFLLGRLAGRFVYNILEQLELDAAVEQTLGRKFAVTATISSFVTWLIYFVFALISLDQLGINTLVLNFLAIAVFAVIVLSLLLAIKDVMPNLVASFIIHQKRIINVGDKIKIKRVEGKVISIDLFETRIKSKKGETTIIPNSLILKEEIVKKN